MRNHECKFRDLVCINEVSDVYSHCVRTMDAISPRFPLLRFAALIHDIGKVPTRSVDKETGDYHFFGHEVEGEKMAMEICARLRFSNEEAEYIGRIVRNHMYFITIDTKPKSIKRWMVNNPDYRDNLRLRIADRKGNLAKAAKPPITFNLKELIKRIRSVEHKQPPMRVTDLAINGHDLIEMGLKPGPVFGKILNHLLDIVLERPDLNVKGHLKEQVRLYLHDCGAF